MRFRSGRDGSPSAFGSANAFVLPSALAACLAAGQAIACSASPVAEQGSAFAAQTPPSEADALAIQSASDAPRDTLELAPADGPREAVALVDTLPPPLTGEPTDAANTTNAADAANSTNTDSADATNDAYSGAADSAATTDALGAICTTSGTELCDDFESGSLNQAIWRVNLGGPSPSVTVDALHAHSGKYAVHARVTPGQQSTAQISESVSFPAANDTFYTRIWAYFAPDVMWPNNPPDYHTGFIIAGGNNDKGHVELAVGANLSPNSAAGPMYYLGYSIYRGPPYVEFGPRSPTRVATLTWTCIELLESGQGGQVAVRRIWVDDQELPEQFSNFGTTSPNGQAPPSFNLVSIGIWEYHPTPSLSDMWIDDVRVSRQRIGCRA